MNQFVFLKNFLFLELTSLGSAYTLVQKFTTDSQVKVFEASPTPRGALLVLASASLDSLNLILASLRGNSEAQTSVENSWLGEDLSEKIIEAYLNQVLTPIKNNLVLVETESICEAIRATVMAVDKNFEICEFRTLRSAIYKCIVSLTTQLSQSEVETIFSTLVTTKKIKLTFVADPTLEIRNQYNLE